MFIAVLFITAKKRETAQTDEWINKCYISIHTMDYYLVIKRNEVKGTNTDQPQKSYAKSKKTDTKGHMYDSIYMRCPKQENPETESRLGVARGWEEGGTGSDC